MNTTTKINQSMIIGFIMAIMIITPITVQTISAQNIGISSTGATPNNSALLDIDAAPGNNKGLLIPRLPLTSTTDVTTITTPANGLVVYNTDSAMTGGNGVGFYSYCATGCATIGWKFMAAADNGPGTAGQVLTSQGSASQPSWTTPTIQTTGGGPTGCADCITQTAVGTTGTWATCRNSCVAMGAGWRIPTFDEETFIASGGLGTPTGGWIANWVWTSTPWDARVAGTPSFGTWVVLNESACGWNNSTYTHTVNCRCVM